jgi:hypothetical protein
MKDIKQVARILKTSAPGPFDELVRHIQTYEKTADDTLVSAISEEIMRQNQGKVQVLRQLLGDLTI